MDASSLSAARVVADVFVTIIAALALLSGSSRRHSTLLMLTSDRRVAHCRCCHALVPLFLCQLSAHVRVNDARDGDGYKTGHETCRLLHSRPNAFPEGLNKLTSEHGKHRNT